MACDELLTQCTLALVGVVVTLGGVVVSLVKHNNVAKEIEEIKKNL